MNIQDIKNYIQGNLNFFRSSNKSLKPHIEEQAEYRKQLCPNCLKNGRCEHCGCKTPEMFYAPNKECPVGLWVSMKSLEEWEEFKSTLDFFQQKNQQKNQEELKVKIEELTPQDSLEDTLSKIEKSRSKKKDTLSSKIDNTKIITKPNQKNGKRYYKPTRDKDIKSDL